jgi:predicted 3-demethylubiquinone-9 3-methyltransferase (glyoxalase superfamily)
MRTITPFLLFSGNAEEAVNFYVSVFRDSSIHKITRCPPGTPIQEGSVLTVEFQLNGQEFVALNGPEAEFTMAVSFQISCETQEEVDHYWSRLSEGGEESWCGWLTDKFGLSWQVTPTIMGKLLGDEDAEKASRVMQAMMRMGKINIQGILAAYESE